MEKQRYILEDKILTRLSDGNSTHVKRRVYATYIYLNPNVPEKLLPTRVAFLQRLLQDLDGQSENKQSNNDYNYDDNDKTQFRSWIH